MVAPGDWTARFDASVFALLALEIAGGLLGILLLGGRTRNNSQPQFADRGVFSHGFWCENTLNTFPFCRQTFLRNYDSLFHFLDLGLSGLKAPDDSAIPCILGRIQ